MLRKDTSSVSYCDPSKCPGNYACVCVCVCTLVFWNVDFFFPKGELRKMFAQGTLFNLMWQLG